MSKEIIEQLANEYLANIEAMKPEGWLEIFAEDGVIYDPVGNPPSKVHEDAQKFFGLLSSLFDKLELSKDNIFIAGNSAAIKWTMRVISKNGRHASTEGISVLEINDAGKIQQVSSYWDESDLMTQLKG
ncbi:MAG: nuclear transport factor 2 family protein [Gomphosphaeria aponina SAG 52.96 = DSM 107014]|uniref:Nuclear transport factor 2 family protein n=1 Tax=Gomphosphaeria aponina SAG 52.96 = DSM 107014 TaxID=1521640 RepID=A0A941JQ69_9CHRO|nr:nuclear transport factor 2 family protein [Gomphosphaeria aponina SAG 52.96 = DSM 107014]